jgi:hypothetical protein
VHKHAGWHRPTGKRPALPQSFAVEIDLLLVLFFGAGSLAVGICLILAGLFATVLSFLIVSGEHPEGLDLRLGVAQFSSRCTRCPQLSKLALCASACGSAPAALLANPLST